MIWSMVPYYLCWALGLIALFYFGIKLISRMSLKQQIYEDSPESHQKKQGTPTMGGLFIFISFFVGVFILNSFNFPSKVLVPSGAIIAETPLWIAFSNLDKLPTAD